MLPFDTSHTTSYSASIVTVSLEYLVPFQSYGVLLSKHFFIYTSRAFSDAVVDNTTEFSSRSSALVNSSFSLFYHTVLLVTVV